MRPRLPVSLVLFVLAAAVYALQVFPAVGVFLMILGGPFWSVLILNAGFIGIGAEAGFRRVPRLWLILPAVWFGGTFTLALTDRIALGLEAQSLRQANAAQRFPTVDPAAGVILEDVSDVSGSSVAVHLISAHDISTVFVRMPGRTIAHRISAGAQCNSFTALGSGGLVRSHGLRVAPAGFDEACITSVEEEPPAGALRLVVRETPLRPDTLITRRMTVSMLAGGRRSEFVTAEGAPHFWLPLPVLGCALNSSLNRWECMTRFVGRSRPRDLLTGQSDRAGRAALIAQALRLRPRTAQTPIPTALSPGQAELSARVTRRALADLDRMLKEPLDQKLNFMDVAALRGNSDPWRDRADAMAASVQTHFANPDAWRSVHAFQVLLGDLPEADFDAVRHRLAPLYRPGAEVASEVAVATVMARLGVSGRDVPGSNAVHIVALADASEDEQQRSRERPTVR